jgi:hypothetical protein
MERFDPFMADNSCGRRPDKPAHLSVPFRDTLQKDNLCGISGSRHSNNMLYSKATSSNDRLATVDLIPQKKHL